MVETAELSLTHGGTTRLIIGSAMEVTNNLGHGRLEKLYENALCVELELRHLTFTQQERFKVHYKTRFIGEYIPDLIVGGKVIVDTKTIERIGNSERGQMLNYLRTTGLRVGLIVNFKHPRLEWERVVL